MSDWDRIKSEAKKLKDGRGLFTDLGDVVDNILDRARINADDTVYVEKAAPESAYESIAYSSIADYLCGDDEFLVSQPDWQRYETDVPTLAEQARQWFKANGYRF